MRNPTLLQCFHWYYPEGGKLWPELAERADGYNDIGNLIFLIYIFNSHKSPFILRFMTQK